MAGDAGPEVKRLFGLTDLILVLPTATLMERREVMTVLQGKIV
jgi:hypothetical protein